MCHYLLNLQPPITTEVHPITMKVIFLKFTMFTKRQQGPAPFFHQVSQHWFIKDFENASLSINDIVKNPNNSTFETTIQNLNQVMSK